MSPRRDCPACGDPLPVDGACDCRDDPERDYRTQKLGRAHALVIRIGSPQGRQAGPDDETIVELWV